MVVVERMIQEINANKLADLEELDKRYTTIEEGLGFPPKKRFWSMAGALDFNTLVIEREWPSLAALEAAYEKSLASPDIQALYAEGMAIIKSSRMELYMPAG